MSDLIMTVSSEDELPSEDEEETSNAKASEFEWEEAETPLSDLITGTNKIPLAARIHQSSLARKVRERVQGRKMAGLPSLSDSEDDQDSDSEDNEEGDVDGQEEDSSDADDEGDDEESDDDDGDDDEESSGDEEEKKPQPKPQKKDTTIKAVTVTNHKYEGRVQFAQLQLSRPLMRAIRDLGWTDATPVQAKAIPLGLGGHDLLVNAVTGSGKTGAFILPIMERLLYRPSQMAVSRVLILTPTRELAAQIYDQTIKMGKFTDIRACVIIGGLSVQAQEVELRARPDIVIATPGRMIDHLRNSHSIHFEELEILVLDEADRLLELGFVDEVKELVKACPRGRQTMLFSATLTDKVQDLVNLSLNSPKRVAVDAFNQIAQGLTQEFIRIRKSREKDREAIVLSLCKRTFKQMVIVFMPSKKDAHRMTILLGLAGLKAAEMHGNLTQAQRLDALDLFKNRTVDILVCTDLAARGLDIKGIETVINFTMPRQFASYVHRVGRTARAGKSGCSVTLVGENQRKELKEVVSKVKGIKSRIVPPEVVAKYTTAIDSWEGDIKDILDQEFLEKKQRIAEMEANKATNLMMFEDQILSRPAKTWFQTEQERLDAKFSSAREHSDLDPSKRMTAKERKAAEREAKQAAKKIDPFKGLSRKKKRAKMMRMEAEKDAREARLDMLREKEESARGGGDADALQDSELGNQKKAKKSKKKLVGEKEVRLLGKGLKKQHAKEMDMLEEVMDSHSGQAPKSKKKKKKKGTGDKVAKRYREEGADRDSKRFKPAKDYQKSVDPETEKALQLKRLQKSKKGSFKSKGRYKRR